MFPRSIEHRRDVLTACAAAFVFTARSFIIIGSDARSAKASKNRSRAAAAGYNAVQTRHASNSSRASYTSMRTMGIVTPRIAHLACEKNKAVLDVSKSFAIAAPPLAAIR